MRIFWYTKGLGLALRWPSVVLTSLAPEYACGATLSHDFDPDVDFYPNIFSQIFFGASTRRMVLVGPRNSHHTTRAGATLALGGARFVRARNAHTEWL